MLERKLRVEAFASDADGYISPASEIDLSTLRLPYRSNRGTNAHFCQHYFDCPCIKLIGCEGRFQQLSDPWRSSEQEHALNLQPSC